MAALTGIATMKPAARIGAGLAGLILAACLTISGRSLFDWLVSAIERPSAPGLLLMIIFAISATTGRSYQSVPEFRFGTAILALGGLVLYPGAIGILNYDTYVLGYSGYLLPLLLAATLDMSSSCWPSTLQFSDFCSVPDAVSISGTTSSIRSPGSWRSGHGPLSQSTF
jgi:hypothetical protein